jgi:2,3-bisphosphoglycerate-independent phosphoglycerate mutase
VAIRFPNRKPDTVRAFDEIGCPTGALGALKNGEFMDLLTRAWREGK